MILPISSLSVQVPGSGTPPSTQDRKVTDVMKVPTKKKALISVVMTTYNGERFLSTQIDSILAQTYPAFEIIIQDDGSTDGTWDLLQEYAGKYKNVSIHRNQQRLGVNQNFITAFKRARGEYISICDQDDVWHSEKLEKYINEFKGNDLCLVYSDSWVCDGELNQQYVLQFSEFNLYEIPWGSPAFGHTIMFRRELLSTIQNLDEVDFIYEWLVSVVAIASGKTKKIPMPLTYWRRHSYTLTDLHYIAPEVKYEKPFLVVIRVFICLFRKEKLPNFEWQFENVYKLLLNFNQDRKVRGLLRFLHYYKKETVVGVFFSSLLYFALRSDLPPLERIKSLYFPIYRYYYYRRDGAGLRGV